MVQGDAQTHRHLRPQRLGRLVYTDRTAGHAGQLAHAQHWLGQVVEAIVDVANVHGASSNRQMFHVADDHKVVQVKTLGALSCPARAPLRDVQRNDLGALARQKLCIHPTAAAGINDRCPSYRR